MAESLPNSKAGLQMQGITKRFGATVALENVDLQVDAGQIHALVGENGAGKSTLMKILSGALQPDQGTMRLAGKPYAPHHPLAARKLGVGMIYQELSLAPHLNVEENLVLGMEPTHWGFLKRKTIRQKAETILAKLGHPEIQAGRSVQELSLSAQQLLEIGRALGLGCRLLILDEPTSSLTQKDSARLFTLMKELKAQGLAIIYISHFLEEVEAIADQVTILRDGKVVDSQALQNLSRQDMVEKMIGRKVETLYPRSSRVLGEAILEIQALAGATKPHRASLTLHRGEVIGVFGLIGAGRSEFLRILFGLDPIRQGKIKVGIYQNDSKHPVTPHERWQQGVGFLSEDRQREGIAPHLSVADNLTLTHLEDYGGMGFFSPQKQRQATEHWIKELEIRCQNSLQPIDALSGGNQQKIALARLLEKDVDLLLLDEPTRGIDVAAKAKIYEKIDQAALGSEGKTPKAVLVVSSYLPELLGLCDRIAVMGDGVLSEARPVSELSEHQLMMEAVEKSG